MHHSLKRNHPALGCGGSGTCDDTLLMGCQSRTGHCGHTDSHPGPFRIAGPSTSTFCMMGSNWKTWRTLMWTWNPTEILTRSSGSNPGAVRKQHYVTNHQTELWGKKKSRTNMFSLSVRWTMQMCNSCYGGTCRMKTGCLIGCIYFWALVLFHIIFHQKALCWRGH